MRSAALALRPVKATEQSAARRTPVDYDPSAPAWSRRLLALVQAPNKHVTLLPRDWRAGLLVIGAHETGKSSVLLRAFLNACLDPGAAVVLIDPKTSLAKRALAAAPTNVKRVWYLNLSRPAFGMSPLRAPGTEQAITGMFIDALRDVFPEQLFQSSRSVIENCAPGALALARSEGRYARIEDVRGLMVWERHELRKRATQALAKVVNGDVVRDYFALELPGDMDGNQAQTRTRLQAPRNKLDALLQSPSLRIFFNHTYEKPLAEIVRDREILIVDANLGKVGDENSRLVISFILRMLDLVLKQQMAMHPEGRSRVHLLIDESTQVFKESTIEMVEKHRESGLTPAFAAHYLAQFETERILEGVLALVANRCMFRTSGDKDSERLAQVARSVLAAVRDTPQSRDRQRITLETLRDLRQYVCVCSWLVGGGREPAFIARSYPMPTVNDVEGNTRHHLLAIRDEVGPYPEHLLWTLRERDEQPEDATGITSAAATAIRRCPHCGVSAVIKSRYDDGWVCWQKKGGCGQRFARDPLLGAEADGGEAGQQAGDGAQAAAPAVAASEAAPCDHAAQGEVSEPTSEQAPGRDSARMLARKALLAASAVRLQVGGAPLGIDPGVLEVAAPQAIKELHEHGELLRRDADPADRPPADAKVPRLNDRDLSALSALDRLGYMTDSQLTRSSYPGRSLRTVQQNLDKLAKAGLVHRYPIRVRHDRGGRAPYLYALAARGLEVAQDPPGDRRPSIPAQRKHRPSAAVEGREIRHNLHVGTWLVSFMTAFPSATSDLWSTPRYQHGHVDVPTVAAGRSGRRPIRIEEVRLDDNYCLVDVSEPEPFAPDLTIELTLPRQPPERPLITDLLVEIDNTGEPRYNEPKFRCYDSFLSGWALAHPRFQRLGTRPIALFVCRDREAMKSLMCRADEVMTGAIGLAGTPQAERWYYAGRDHTSFTYQELIHYGLPTAWMLPPHPPKVREQLGDRDGYRMWPVSLLAPELIDKQAMVGWELRAGKAVRVSKNRAG